jgi:LysM repeat protein
MDIHNKEANMNRFKKVTIFIAGVLISLSLCSTTAFAADYTVVKKDTLKRISTLFSTPVSTLKSSNQLTSNVIHPGQVLEVPAKIHTVKKGETLSRIAKNYGISLYSLRKANHKWNYKLKIGQKLIIPGIKPANTNS